MLSRGLYIRHRTVPCLSVGTLLCSCYNDDCNYRRCNCSSILVTGYNMKKEVIKEITKYLKSLGFSKNKSLFYKQINNSAYLITKICTEQYIKILRNPNGIDCHINTGKELLDIQFDIVSQKDMELILKHHNYAPTFELSFFASENKEEWLLSEDEFNDKKVFQSLSENFYLFVYKQVFETHSFDIYNYLSTLEKQRFGNVITDKNVF